MELLFVIFGRKATSSCVILQNSSKLQFMVETKTPYSNIQFTKVFIETPSFTLIEVKRFCIYM